MSDEQRYAVQLETEKQQQRTYKMLIAGAVVVLVGFMGALSYNNHLNTEKKVEFYQTANSEDIENYLINGYLP